MNAEKKGLLAEFKDFVATGDLMTIAVAFIMAGLIKDVVESFIKDIVMGIIGLAAGCNDILGADGKPSGKQDCTGVGGKAYKSIAYGTFINQVVVFLITAFIVFMLIKAYTKMSGRKLATGGPTEVDLLTEIRDSLKSR